MDTGIGDFRNGFLRFCLHGNNTTPAACKTLIVAQKLSTGSATAGEIIEVFSVDDAIAKFGAGSIAAETCRVAFQLESLKSVFVWPLADATGAVQAVYDIGVSGPATESGTIHIQIFGTDYSIPVVSGDTANTIAAALQGVLAADANLPYVATVSTNTVTLTARNGGTVGNYLQIIENPYIGQKFPAGVSFSVAQTTPGATDPVISTSDIADATGGCCYECFALTWQDETAIQAFVTYLDDETGTWACGSDMCFGELFHAKTGADGGAIATYAGASNDQERVIVPHKSGYKFAPWQLVTAVARRTCINACADPSRPVVRDNGMLTGFHDAGHCGGIWTRAEKEAMVKAGVLAWDVSNQTTTAGSVLWIENNVTNYKTNATGRPDQTWQQVATRFQVRALVLEMQAWAEANFPSVALVKNGVSIPAGRKAVNPNMVEVALRGFLRQYNGILIDDADNLEGKVTVKRNTDGQPCGHGDPNRLDVYLDIDFANQLLRMAFGVNIVIEGNCNG